VRIMILGASGMLGHKLVQILTRQHDVVAAFRDSSRWAGHPVFGRAACVSGVDASHFDSVARAIAQARPKAVINAVGLIKQLQMAKEPLPTITLNSLFPHQLAALCRDAGARLIHISTDCVFSGLRGSYTEQDLPDPVDLYGRSKLLGELASPGCLTLRTSIIGRELAGGHGLVEWFLANRGRQVSGYTHAIYSGLTTTVLSETIEWLIGHHPELSGLYHVSSAPISKYDLLVMFRDALGLTTVIDPDDRVRCDRSLDSTLFNSRTGWVSPSWADMTNRLAAEAAQYEQWNH
jgi:dTDP-4-dehydrorhamnose reductase